MKKHRITVSIRIHGFDHGLLYLAFAAVCFFNDYLTFPAIVLSENTSNCAVCSRAVSFWLWALSENRVLQNPAIYHLVSYSNGHSGVPPFSVKRNYTGNKYPTTKNN